MLQKGFLKEDISIKAIGKQRFWIGILCGLIAAFVLTLFFNYSRESLRAFTVLSGDLLKPTIEEYRFYNIFFAAFALSLGLSVTIGVWFGNMPAKASKQKITLQLAQSNAQLIFWMMLMVVARFGSILPLILYGQTGYDQHLQLFREFSIIFYLIPIIIFLYSWNIVRLVFNSTKWIISSLITISLLTFILANVAKTNHSLLDQAYYNTFKSEFEYISRTIKKARSQYDIQFTQEEIRTLKQRKSKSAQKQVVHLQKLFTTENKLKLKTIILEKIVVHNAKICDDRFYPRNHENSYKNWCYAHPNDVYNQIQKFDIGTPEVKELFLLLNEMYRLAHMPKLNWKHYEKYSRLERRKSHFAGYRVPYFIFDELEATIEKIRGNERYKDYTHLLEKDYRNSIVDK